MHLGGLKPRTSIATFLLQRVENEAISKHSLSNQESIFKRHSHKSGFIHSLSQQPNKSYTHKEKKQPSKYTKTPSFLRHGLRCLTITAGKTFFQRSGFPFLTVAITMSPTQAVEATIDSLHWDYVEALGPCVVRTVHCCCHWKTQRHPEIVPGTSSTSCKSTNTKTIRERWIKPLIPFFVLRKIFNKYKQPRKNDQNPFALFGPWRKKIYIT